MDRVIIKKNDNGSFDVHVGDRYADHLTYDEMLGLVSQVFMPENRRTLQWLKTEKEHQQWLQEIKQKDDDKQ